MSPKLKKSLISLHRDFIKFLRKIRPSQRKAVIAKCRRPELDCLSEIFHNFLRNHLTSNKKIIKKLHPHRAIIRELSRKSTPLKRKRRILNGATGGSILSLLLPIVTSVIGSLI